MFTFSFSPTFLEGKKKNCFPKAWDTSCNFSCSQTLPALTLLLPLLSLAVRWPQPKSSLSPSFPLWARLSPFLLRNQHLSSLTTWDSGHGRSEEQTSRLEEKLLGTKPLPSAPSPIRNCSTAQTSLERHRNGPACKACVILQETMLG